MAKAHFTAEYIRDHFAYDPDTGIITNKIARPGNPICSECGTSGIRGRIQLGIDGKIILAHRIAWVIVTGEWPELIDHIDGNAANNRWNNLRVANKRINGQNRRRANNGNETGFLGVRKLKRCRSNKYEARINVNGKDISLGRFTTPEDAYVAYICAKRRFHDGCTI